MVCHEGCFQFLSMVHCRRLLGRKAGQLAWVVAVLVPVSAPVQVEEVVVVVVPWLDYTVGRSEMFVVEVQQVELAAVIGCFEQVEGRARLLHLAERGMLSLSLILWCRVH